MDLILQLNDQVKEMEKELDSLIQLKHASFEISTTIPIVTTTVPSTLAALLASTAPLAIVLPTATTSTSTTGSIMAATQPCDEVRKLVKAMEDMSIQTSETNSSKKR